MKEQPKYYAFFDVDNTVIKIKSMRSFLKYFYKMQHPLLGRYYYKLFEMGTNWYLSRGVSREFLNQRNFKKLKGYDASTIQMMCKAWFRALEGAIKDLYIKETVQQIENHKANGGEIVFVSGAFDWCLRPIAKKLNVDHCLSIRLHVDDGVCTGHIIAPQTIGEGKVEAIKNFLSEQGGAGVDLSQCYAYGDHISDLPMLNYVGNPCVVAGDKKLESHAREYEWPVISAN